MEKALKIAVTGEIRSGKDSFSEYIMATTVGTEKLYFADGIEEVIHLCFPEAFDNGKPRKLYQDIGTFMRSIDPDVWVKYTERIYKLLTEFGTTSFVATDLRQPNEYEWLKANGFTVVKVETEFEIRKARAEASGDVFDLASFEHPVEQSIRTLPYDYLVTNNTTIEDLYEQADFILQELKGEENGTFK